MRKIYIQPTTKIHRIKVENMLITTSPGIGDEWDDGMVIQAKKNTVIIDDDDEWEE